jgi:hypothetical protein
VLAVLNQCNYVVLDEADRMIDLGFEPQVGHGWLSRGQFWYVLLVGLVRMSIFSSPFAMLQLHPYILPCVCGACVQVMAVLDAMPSTNLKPDNEGDQLACCLASHCSLPIWLQCIMIKM